MDDDDPRHGVAACHTVYGLPTATLAGDSGGSHTHLK